MSTGKIIVSRLKGEIKKNQKITMTGGSALVSLVNDREIKIRQIIGNPVPGAFATSTATGRVDSISVGTEPKKKLTAAQKKALDKKSKLDKKYGGTPKNLFQKILKRAYETGKFKDNQLEAVEWLRNSARRLKVNNSDMFNQDPSKRYVSRDKMQFGYFYMFQYDAEHKDKLPFWDEFPITIFFNKTAKGNKVYYHGINLHYLPPTARGRMMDILWQLKTDDRLDGNTRLRVTWQILKALAEDDARFALKTYIVNNIRSKMIKIYADEWDIAVFLPLAKWKVGIKDVSSSRVNSAYTRRVASKRRKSKKSSTLRSL